MTAPTYLAKKNAHPRDADISFEEGPHIYTVLGERGTYTSVTTWNHGHFSHFDADAVIDKMMAGRNWNNPDYKYYGMTREEIKAMWEKMSPREPEQTCTMTLSVITMKWR